MHIFEETDKEGSSAALVGTVAVMEAERSSALGQLVRVSNYSDRFAEGADDRRASDSMAKQPIRNSLPTRSVSSS